VALVALAIPRDGVDHPLEGSGFLVPPSEGRLMTACSWWSSKWPHLAHDPSLVLLRVSAGRDGDRRALALDDGDLLDALLLDLRDTLDLHAAPVDVRINRWHRSFPQPRPGHLARVDALDQELSRSARGLAVAGAWARGVGIPACIRAGRRAAGTALGMRSSAR
jgi:oxygen-dependent protoporphyrinogen oxidase